MLMSLARRYLPLASFLAPIRQSDCDWEPFFYYGDILVHCRSAQTNAEQGNLLAQGHEGNTPPHLLQPVYLIFSQRPQEEIEELPHNLFIDALHFLFTNLLLLRFNIILYYQDKIFQTIFSILLFVISQGFCLIRIRLKVLALFGTRQPPGLCVLRNHCKHWLLSTIVPAHLLCSEV